MTFLDLIEKHPGKFYSTLNELKLKGMGLTKEKKKMLMSAWKFCRVLSNGEMIPAKEIYDIYKASYNHKKRELSFFDWFPGRVWIEEYERLNDI